MFNDLKEKKRKFDESKIGSIIKLSIWFILIIIFASFTKSNGSSSNVITPVVKPTSTSIKSSLKGISSYEADVVVESDIVYNIHLTNSFNKYLILYNGEKYYKNDFLYLLPSNEIVSNSLIDDIIYYSIGNISNYLENIDEDYITIYKDNSYMVSYTLYKDDSTINVIVKGNSDVSQVIINFNDYYIRSIVINLSNINNIENIEVD